MVRSYVHVALICALAMVSGIHAYSVTGNQLYGPDGKTIRIRGIDRPSLEWAPGGQNMGTADYALMKAWGFNCVRLSLNQDFWLAGSATYNSNYRNTVATQVANIKALSMGVILDLHWSDMGNANIANADQQLMADTRSITFWSQVSAAYANDPWIMFELYNEPHDVSWDLWRNGGSTGGWTVAGMQQLYNAVRVNANNVVIINGLNWAYDLSGVITGGYAITGTNIAYGTHAYNYAGKLAGDWDSGFGNLAGTYPVIMTEFGQYCAEDGYVAAVVAYNERKGIHWTAWGWWPGGCNFPSIINDWTGAPTDVGLIVKGYLTASSTTPASPVVGATSAPAAPPVGATSAPINNGNTNTGSGAGTVSTALNIFASSILSGWTDGSWGTYRINGNIATLTLASYGGFSLYTNTAITSASYASLQFGLYSSTSTPQLKVFLYDSAKTELPTSYSINSVTANQLVVQTIPLSALGASTSIRGFAIMYNSGSVTSNTVQITSVSMIPVNAPQQQATQAPATQAPTPVPATQAPTPVPATQAPTPKPATQAPPQPATQAPTPRAATQAPPQPATQAPTPKAATQAPPQPATQAPTPKAATNPPAGTGSSTGPVQTADCPIPCTASCISVSHALATSWTDNVGTVSQYNVAITNRCPNQGVSALTFNLANWNPVTYWNAVQSGNTLSPSIWTGALNAGTTMATVGYQNRVGQAVFTVASVTFA